MLLAPIGGVAEAILDGSYSTDAEGDELDYIWTWTDGITYTVYGVNPVITLPVGEHVIELVVSDGVYDSEPDYVTVEVLDIAIGLAKQISTVITDKLDLIEQINAALEKEQAVCDTLEELLASGDIVAAGYTGNDTKGAAQDLIAALDALMA